MGAGRIYTLIVQMTKYVRFANWLTTGTILLQDRYGSMQNTYKV